MGSTTMTELRLDLRPSPPLPMVNGLVRKVSAGGVGEVEEYLRGLEEERRKIEAFRRELPLCMLLVTDVISELKEFLRHGVGEGKTNKEGAGMEESEIEREEKANWLSSVQLWSDNNGRDSQGIKNRNQNASKSDGRSDPLVVSKGESGRTTEMARVAPPPPPELSLLTSGIEVSRPVPSLPGKDLTPSLENAHANLHEQRPLQSPRKARRCWSPELHRRFISAIQQLGGSHVATPKQIRELMKVDGLTNDEVKSHLQKYRLHTRRCTPSSTLETQPGASPVGLWTPSLDQLKDLKTSDSLSVSPKGPLQFAHAMGGILAVGVDSCEEEDGKSESYSWKGNSQALDGEETD